MAPDLNSRTFTCKACGRTFEKGWSDAEALVEMEVNLKPVPKGEDDTPELVCDECHPRFMAWARRMGLVRE